MIRAKNPTSIEINEIQRLNLLRVYQDLVYQFDELDLPLMRKKAEIIVCVIDFVKEAIKIKDLDRINKASIIMRAIMISPDPEISWLYDVDIAETKDQKELIMNLAIRIKAFNEAKVVEGKKEVISIEEVASQLSMVVGFHINIKKTSVLQFDAYKKQAREKVKMMNNE